MNFDDYISPNIRKGLFNRVGTRHLHVDSENVKLLPDIARFSFEHSGFPSRTNRVVELLGGPQREMMPEAYEDHHPATTDEPLRDSFTSTALQDYDHTLVETLLRDTLRRYEDVTIELEEVVMVVGWDNEISMRFEPIDGIDYQLRDVKVSTPHFLKFEYHHGFNLPKSSTRLDGKKLVDDWNSAGVTVGSLYVFDAPDYVAYRTNAFIEDPGAGESVAEENRIVREVLASRGMDLPVRTALERVVGIWHS